VTRHAAPSSLTRRDRSQNASISAAELIERHRRQDAPHRPRHSVAAVERAHLLPSFATARPIRVIVRPVLAAATVAATISAIVIVTPHLQHTAKASQTQPVAAAVATTGSARAVSTAAATVGSVVSLPTTPAPVDTMPRAHPNTTRVSRNYNRTSLLRPGQTVPGLWVLPNTGPYTSCFCARWGTFHYGIDLAGPLGSPILAVGDGTVLEAGPAEGFGNWVVVQHANGDVSIYGHMKYFFVHKGEKVTAGEKIALVGAEGEATGPHLHFEVHQGGLNGPKIDPIPWLKARGIIIGPYDPNG
jgi:murein DD-endopeptidase MepM/ murein hydrolase activator NlpD